MICVIIGYPVAYFVSRKAGKRKGLFLVLILTPFWINYLMRMLAWVNLLSNDGLVNSALQSVGLSAQNWLGGQHSTVILGSGLRLRAVLHLAALQRPRPHRPPGAGGRS